jgi:hypothetical protein
MDVREPAEAPDKQPRYAMTYGYSAAFSGVILARPLADVLFIDMGHWAT